MLVSGDTRLSCYLNGYNKIPMRRHYKMRSHKNMRPNKKTAPKIKKNDSGTSKKEKKDIFWHAAFWEIVAGVTAIIGALLWFYHLGFLHAPDFPKAYNTIDVSECINMSAYDAKQFLDFDDYSEGDGVNYFFRTGKDSLFECEDEYFNHNIPSY